MTAGRLCVAARLRDKMLQQGVTTVCRLRAVVVTVTVGHCTVLPLIENVLTQVVAAHCHDNGIIEIAE